MLLAVGQLHLMALYEQLSDLYGRTVAQVLLARQDISRCWSHLNPHLTETERRDRSPLAV